LLLFGSVAQATTLVGFHHGFIHWCHKLPKYDAYETRRPDFSGGA
jgi:hypothetical protein